MTGEPLAKIAPAAQPAAFLCAAKGVPKYGPTQRACRKLTSQIINNFRLCALFFLQKTPDVFLGVKKN